MKPPLPIRDGVGPSHVWVQAGEGPALLPFLAARFPDVSAEVWLDRIARGELVDKAGRPLATDSTVRRGDCLFYYRELAYETPVPFQETVLFRDEHLLIADKPHFLPVIPTGRHLQETLLVRLKRRFGLDELTPIHRIDRDTAGLVVFSLNPASRGVYQSLFQRRAINKTYEAIAPALPGLDFPFVHRSRMVPGTPFFRMQEAPGEPNSETWIDLIGERDGLCHYRLQPVTGRKHQLRVHLAGLGAPIVGDVFYPEVREVADDDFSQPLKLLARAIAFTDPINGESREFVSERRL
ncbi:RluA family pseudouridine synthase [Crenobacter sp. SG2305]|uniref:RluA family pseudouridine synthase n=1 Tax=Crenobacter oryzisoli TaxID=3056844 RepID=UPI0025AB4599|nr:RluA family pseudouridine synthase [Crenobacter sp. SG2305]MDN0084752.1 RluA family pseudouridine synthase [Crenobacter sp. SG2305]